MATGLFIGSVEEYKEQQEKQRQERLHGVNADGTVRKIAYDNMDPISDDDLKILKQTINRHDAQTVYMQSDIGFYDEYYHEDDSIEGDLLREAKKIRRIYKSYPKYLYAMYIRNLYLDFLADKHGGPDRFETYFSMGIINEWIPPIPVFSKSSSDYEQYKSGVIELNSVEFIDDDKLSEHAKLITEEEGIDINEVGVTGDVMTSPVVLRHINDSSTVTGITARSNNNAINGVDMDDLISIQNMFRSWYRPQVDTNVKPIEDLFSNTPEKIRERFYTSPIVDMGESKFGGDIVEIEPDPNEMVIDKTLNRPMTRKEYEQREFIRLMSRAGWNEVRMMRYLGVGSKYEQQLMFNKEKRKNKANKKAKGLIDDILGGGSSMEYIDSIDQLKGALFGDDDYR
jgi:hypothetical protein